MVRHRIGAAGLRTDVLGELVAFEPDTLVVRTEDGREHTVARTDVVAAKRVPPRPPRYSEMLDLERVADRCWPAPVHERLGQWLLRAADGWTGRANSALPLGDPGLPLPDAVEAVVRWYGERGLTPRVNVPLPVRRDVADQLDRLGWSAQPLVLVQTARVATVPGPAVPVRLDPRPSAEFLALMAGQKGALPEVARSILHGPDTVAFAEVPGEDGRPLAIARGAVVEGWLHLGLVQVAGAARRRGYGRAVTSALAAWSRGHGAGRAVLQVEQRNTAAVGLYAGLGFTTHHQYVTYHR